MMLPLLLAAVLSAGRSAPQPAPIEVRAVLTTPHDILVTWRDPEPNAAGHAVEWGTSPQDDFVVLGFLPPDRQAYQHPDLIPDTTCCYRVRAYYGPVSREVDVALPAGLTDAAYAAAFAKPENYQWAAPKTRPDALASRGASIRDPSTIAAAAPAEFQVALVRTTVSGLQLTWTDRSSDEEGFMVEMKPEGSSTYQVVALVPPDTNAFGWAFNPPMRHAKFRVRAYYYGSPSMLVSQHTGPADAKS